MQANLTMKVSPGDVLAACKAAISLDIYGYHTVHLECLPGNSYSGLMVSLIYKHLQLKTWRMCHRA